MKNKFPKSVVLALLGVASFTLTSCGKDDKDTNVQFWSSFGSAYTSTLNIIVDGVQSSTGIGITHKSKGSYDGIYDKMISAIKKGEYPNIVTGYPNHFAMYQVDDALLPLEDYIDAYNEKHNTDLFNDFYPEYKPEVQSIEFDRSTGEGYIMALPFNKSTELLGYNGTFVNYCAQLCQEGAQVGVGATQMTLTAADDLGTVPTTWQKWETQGPKYRAVLDSLLGHKLYGKMSATWEPSDFALDTEGGGRSLLLDFSKYNYNDHRDLTRVISWDSTDNMFITMCQQWGADYTYITNDQKKTQINFRKGNVAFNSSTNRPKVQAAMEYFYGLNKQKIFGVPGEFDQSYNSTAFKTNQVMFMICSSGGLTYNTQDPNQRFKVTTVPYYDDGSTKRKIVVSQGADIALTDAGNFDDSFEVMAALTTGDAQAKWCIATGYYPCSKSARNSIVYQQFLSSTEYDNATNVAFREGSVVNDKEYMDTDDKYVDGSEDEWTKVIDPAFPYSSEVRTFAKNIFNNVAASVVDLNGMNNQEQRYAKYKEILDKWTKAIKDKAPQNIIIEQ